MLQAEDINRALDESQRRLALGTGLDDGMFLRGILRLALGREAHKLDDVSDHEVRALIMVLADSCSPKQHVRFMNLLSKCMAFGMHKTDPLLHHFGAIFWGKDLTHDSPSC